MANLRKSRWVMTLNNYNVERDYNSHLRNPVFKIKRAVIGKEISNEGTRHLQCYVEFDRSYRLGHCRKIFGLAFWDCARESALVNFRYFTKSGNFSLIGDFTKEQCGIESVFPDAAKVSIPLIVQGLLNKETATQTKLYKEYFEKSNCFDKVTMKIKQIQQDHKLFSLWSPKLLRPWQFACIELLFSQDDRQILWIVDTVGNFGKSFLAQYLSILYGYQLVDGSLNCRDAAFLISEHSKGFCFDISRCSVNTFEYSTLECLKNGVIMTGKYSGRVKRFSSLPIVVFSNSRPVYTALSEDRWKVHVLGNNPFANISNIATILPSHTYPFVAPEPMPDLSESFNLREFLEMKLLHTIEPEQQVPTIAADAAASADDEHLLQLGSHDLDDLPSTAEFIRNALRMDPVQQPQACDHTTRASLMTRISKPATRIVNIVMGELYTIYERPEVVAEIESSQHSETMTSGGSSSAKYALSFSNLKSLSLPPFKPSRSKRTVKPVSESDLFDDSDFDDSFFDSVFLGTSFGKKKVKRS